MYTKDAIRYALEMANTGVLGPLASIEDVPTAFPTPNGGCHPLWVVGHLALVEGSIPGVLYGEPNPVECWQTLFGENTEPVADLDAYPPLAEVRAKYSELRDRNLAL